MRRAQLVMRRAQLVMRRAQLVMSRVHCIVHWTLRYSWTLHKHQRTLLSHFDYDAWKVGPQLGSFFFKIIKVPSGPFSSEKGFFVNVFWRNFSKLSSPVWNRIKLWGVEISEHLCYVSALCKLEGKLRPIQGLYTELRTSIYRLYSTFYMCML